MPESRVGPVAKHQYKIVDMDSMSKQGKNVIGTMGALLHFDIPDMVVWLQMYTSYR